MQRSPWCRPLFRWVGSKRSLLPLLLACAPDSYGRYLEPFAGSACFFFALNPARAVLGDFNAELIRAYDVIASHPRLVARKVAELPGTKAAYYKIRSLDPESLGDISRAARFTYLNRNCFNGVYRTDRSNRFNVPKGVRPGRPLSEAEVFRCSVALRAARLVTGDFDLTLRQARRNDFVYLDPPYSGGNRPTFGEYGYGAFAPGDVDRLIKAIRLLSAQGTHVLMSYTADEQILHSLRSWSVISVQVQRQVAGGGRSAPSSEILASNYSDLNAVYQHS